MHKLMLTYMWALCNRLPLGTWAYQKLPFNDLDLLKLTLKICRSPDLYPRYTEIRNVA